MAYSLPHTIGEIKACVEKLIEEDIVRQQATIDLAVQLYNASTAKDYMRKAYEKFNDIPQETRALIETFLNEESWKDYEMHNTLFRKTLLPIIAGKVQNEKVQQEKLKEVKARLNFEVCSRRNSKIQETSQYSESRTPNKIEDLRRRLKPRRSRNMSRSPKPTSVFSGIWRDIYASPRHRQGDKRRKDGDVFHRLGVEEEVCPHTKKAATKVPVHEERSRSQKVKTVKGDIGSQG
ncbi:hypothetical protein Tco_1166887 [Tanacetum coccineum]